MPVCTSLMGKPVKLFGYFKELADSVLEVSIRANRKIVEELRR